MRLSVFLRPRAAVAVLIVGALAACGPQAETKAEAKEDDSATSAQNLTAPVPTLIEPAADWTCADGQTLKVAFYRDPEFVEIRTNDGAEYMIPPAVSASGALYESEAHRFHSKGDEAQWKNAQGVETSCRRAAAQ